MQLLPSGPPLRIDADYEYTVDRQLLAEDEGVLFVSDGCYEWKQGNDIFGWERFASFVEQSLYKDPKGFWVDLLKKIPFSPRDQDDVSMMFFRNGKNLNKGGFDG